MLVLLRCVAEAAMENGVGGLAEMVPGGKYAYDVAAAAWKKYRERKKDAEAREEIRQLAQANFEEARRAAVEAVREAAAAAAPEDRSRLESYLSQVPGAVRASLKRPEDATGRTVPAAFALNSADDLVRLLPGRPPRFGPGDPLPGMAGWRLAELLGAGGFGEVWLARHESMPSLCGAVKFCHGRQARDLKHEGGLIDRVMAAGPHPNIVPLRNAHLDGDAPWLMYEYVPGGDLADLIRRWQGPDRDRRVQVALVALKQLAAAVAHFHRMTPAIVHRDLKPANVLYDRVNKRLRVTDFGIGAVAARAALAEESRGGATAAGRLMSYMRGSHTPLYASPQQRDGRDPDPRDDVYALGVIAFQMLTGDLGAAPGRDMDDDLSEAGAPEALVALVGRSVAQRAERRPGDAGEWLAALAALAPGQPAEARQDAARPTEPNRPAEEPAPEAGEVPRLRPNALAILKALKKRGATSAGAAVSKYLLMAEDGVGPHCYNLEDDGLIDWVEQPKSPVPELTKSKWTLWVTPAGLRAIDDHILLGERKKKAGESTGDAEDEAGGEEARWEGFWFVNVGESDWRNWDDCRKYGFLSAGWGEQYSGAMKKLRPGDRVFAYMKGLGYVGYGEVGSAAVMARDFTPAGSATRLLELPLAEEGLGHDADDEEMAEWVVGVRWHKTFDREEARTYSGAFAGRLVVCRLRDVDTLKFLKKQFQVAE
jgi:serine/threonine protein kinase